MEILTITERKTVAIRTTNKVEKSGFDIGKNQRFYVAGNRKEKTYYRT